MPVTKLRTLLVGLLLVGVAAAPGSAAELHGDFTLEMGVGLVRGTSWSESHIQWQTGLDMSLHQPLTGGAADVQITTTAGEQGSAAASLGEATLRLEGATGKIVVGRQVVAWGTAVKINPIDVVNPVRLGDDDLSRMPVAAVVATEYLPNDVELTGVWIPEFRPAATAIPALPSVPVTMPTPSLANTETAARVVYRGKGYDLTGMVFSGWTDQPVLHLTAQGPKGAYERINTYGGSAITALGTVGVWVEGGYTVPVSSDWDQSEFVAGGDYQTLGGYYVMAQYHQFNHGGRQLRHAVGAVEKDFGLMNTGRIGIIGNLDNGSLLVKPEIDRSLSDALVLTLSAAVTEERGNGLGLPAPRSGLRVKLTSSF